MAPESIKLVKPAWKETLKFLAGALKNKDKAAELIDLISKDYFTTKNKFDSRDYNPHLDDLCLAAECIGENEEVFNSSSKIAGKIVKELTAYVQPEIETKDKEKLFPLVELPLNKLMKIIKTLGFVKNDQSVKSLVEILEKQDDYSIYNSYLYGSTCYSYLQKQAIDSLVRIGTEKSLTKVIEFILSDGPNEELKKKTAEELAKVRGYEEKVVEAILEYTKRGNPGANLILSYVSESQLDKLITFLNSNHPKSSEALLALKKRPSKKGVMPLLNFLQSDHPNWHSAVYTLLGYDELAKDAVHKFMCTNHPKSVYGAIILGEMGDIRAIEPLVQAFYSAPNLDLLDQYIPDFLVGKGKNKAKVFRSDVASALVSTDCEKAVRPVIESLMEFSLSHNIMKSTENVANLLVTHSIKKLNENNLEHWQRRNLLRAISRAKGSVEISEATEYLMEIINRSYLKNDENSINEAGVAIDVLRGYNQKKVTTFLSRVIIKDKTTNSDKRPYEAAVALRRMGEEGIKELISLLDKTNPHRSYAIINLGESNNKKAVEPLIDLLKSTPESELKEQRYIIQALGKLKAKEATEVIIETMTRITHSKRFSEQVSKIGYWDHINVKEIEFVSDGINTLGEIGDEISLTFLLDFLPYPYLNLTALQAINKFANEKHVEIQETISTQFKNMWPYLSDDLIVGNVIEILGKVGNSKSILFLGDSLRELSNCRKKYHLEKIIQGVKLNSHFGLSLSYGEILLENYQAIESIHHRNKPTTY